MNSTIVVLSGLLACQTGDGLQNDDRSADGGFDAGSAEEATDFAKPVLVRIDILPDNVLNGATLDEGFRAMPRSSPRIRLDGTENVDVGSLQLERPIRFTGQVEGFRANPQVSASLPGEILAVPATVRLWLPNTVQDYVISTDEVGEFGAWIAPRTVYNLSVKPLDPSFPPFEDTVAITDSARDLALNLSFGAPVYGRIQTADGPIVGAEVHLVDDAGERSAVAISDEDGWYTVRTLPGTYDVVCDGGNSPFRPTLTHREVVVDDLGAFVDFDYLEPVPLLVDGRVSLATEVDVDLGGAEVRFRSENIIGYGAVDAEWAFTARLQDGEIYVAQLIPGSYDVEVIPPRRQADALDDPFNRAVAPDVSPDGLREVLVVESMTLDDIELPETALVLGSVEDRDGVGQEATYVSCTEVSFGRRQWSVLSDAFGRFQIQLPQVPMRCNVTPTAESQLAPTSFTFVPGEREGPVVVLPNGIRLTGRVLGPDGGTEQFAAVTVRREDDGRVLGTALTNAEGRYEIRVAP